METKAVIVPIFVTICKNPTHDYPYAVIINGQELQCRSIRDCQVAVSGACTAICAINARSEVKWDERITKPVNG